MQGVAGSNPVNPTTFNRFKIKYLKRFFVSCFSRHVVRRRKYANVRPCPSVSCRKTGCRQTCSPDRLNTHFNNRGTQLSNECPGIILQKNINRHHYRFHYIAVNLLQSSDVPHGMMFFRNGGKFPSKCYRSLPLARQNKKYLWQMDISLFYTGGSGDFPYSITKNNNHERNHNH